MKLTYYIISLIILHSTAFTQNMNVYDVNTDEYPLIHAKFYVTDGNDVQIKNFQNEDFTIYENQVQKFVQDIKCPSNPVFNKISTVLTIDVSGSMKGERLDWVKSAASQWIEQMDSLNEETAITTFDDEALLYSDFKINKQLLLNSVASLEIRNGTNYKNAFLDPYAGALDIVRRARFQPIIIFLTDGIGLSNFDPKDIINKASISGAIIYAISIDISLPEEMKKVSEATGGQYFENIDSQDKLEEAYKTIRQIAINTSPCDISWYTDGCVLGRVSTIKYLPLNLTKDVSYSTSSDDFPEFEYLDDEFALFECNKASTYILRLKAINDKIDIYGFEDNSNISACNDFTAQFVGRKVPFTLQKDSILEIRISYNPSNSDYNFCSFIINASSCLNNQFYAVSNCLDSPPSNVLLKVRRPNGGEVYKANSIEKIFWDGTSKDDDLMVDYSIDSGKNWSLVNAGKFYNNTDWILPNIESDNCLVRVKKMSNKAGRKIYDLNVDSSNVNRISWNKRGNLFAIVSDTNSIKLVNSITGVKINEIYLTTDTSPFKDVQFLPDGARLFVTNSNGLFLLNLINKKFQFIDSVTGEIELSKDEGIITITNPDSVSILDIQKRKIINTFKKPFVEASITDAAISNDSRKIAIAVNSDNNIDSIYVLEKSLDWDVVTNYTLTDTTLNYSYFNIDWSVDDKFIITTSRYKTSRFLELWDYATKKKIFKIFNPHNVNISDISVSPIENLIVTIDLNSNIKVWELTNNLDIYNFEEKYNFLTNSFLNNSIVWSPDASRFAVGTTGKPIDKLLAVYAVKTYPETEDISDSVFSIVKNVFDIHPIDMGEELIGITKDTTIKNYITYKLGYTFQIDSISLSGNDANSFSVTNSPNLPAFVSSNNQPEFNISFTPIKEGDVFAKMNIYTQYGVKTATLLGKGVIPLIQTEDYNFGEVLITKDSLIVKNSIKNNGNFNLRIKRIYLVGPSNQFFDITDKNNNVISELNDIDLSPDGKYELGIKFSPLIAEIENARIKIEYLDESNSTKIKYINLYGEGINPQLSTKDLNFNSVICDDFNTQKATLYNTGRGKLIINDIQLNSVNFRVLDNFKFNEIIDQGDSLTFTVEFSPIDNGIIKDSILIFTNQLNNSTHKIYLNARKLATSFIIEGNNSLVGVNSNTPINESFKIINNGKTPLIWSPPYQSVDGKITINSIIPNPTLPGDTSQVSYQFTGGEKGENFQFKFAPEPYCSDSVDINIQIKNTNPTLYTDFENTYHLVCKDTLEIKILITNIGEEELNITNIRFENGNTTNFNIDKKIVNLSENESDTLLLTFNSSVPGIYNTNIVFISNDPKSIDGKLVIPLRVIKDISKFEVIEDKIDFIFVGLNNPGNKKFTIKNSGTIPIRWNLTPLSNFNIVSIIPPVAPPNTNSEVTISYTGPDDLSNEYTLFVSDSCENLDSISLNVVTANKGTALLKLANEKRKIGEKFNFLITLLNASKLEEAGVTSIRGNLIFNHSLMIPTTKNSTINNGIRSVPFEIKNLIKGTELPIEMEVLWGDDSCSTVSISNLQAMGNTTEIDLNQIPGSICVSDLCYEGGVRLIDLSKKLNASLKYNPSINNKLEIKLDLIEQGKTSINLYDVSGRIIKNIASENMNSGLKLINVDLSEIQNGLYFIEIDTPSIKLYRKLFVVR